MIQFFSTQAGSVIAVQAARGFSEAEIAKMIWLLSEAKPLDEQSLSGIFVGPRREMITPWSTNAVEIAANLGVDCIQRMEEFFPVQSEEAEHDSMLQRNIRPIITEVVDARTAVEAYLAGSLVDHPEKLH